MVGLFLTVFLFLRRINCRGESPNTGFTMSSSDPRPP